MQPVMSALLAFVVSLFRSRASLCLENLALRHQVAIYKQTIPRPRLHPTDRLFWAWLSRLWSGWQEALTFVQPRTVIAWQRQRFRDHWRRLSQRGKPGPERHDAEDDAEDSHCLGRVDAYAPGALERTLDARGHSCATAGSGSLPRSFNRTRQR